jgi:hypothetical protein
MCHAQRTRANCRRRADQLAAVLPPLIRDHSEHHTVLTGLLDRSALYDVLAEIEALGLDLLEVR